MLCNGNEEPHSDLRYQKHQHYRGIEGEMENYDPFNFAFGLFGNARILGISDYSEALRCNCYETDNSVCGVYNTIEPEILKELTGECNGTW